VTKSGQVMRLSVLCTDGEAADTSECVPS
jgi:hypothetical protein